MPNRTPSRGRRARWLALAVALCLAPIGLLHAEQLGRCVEAEIPETLVLPDGSHYPAGELRICYTRAHSPVAGLHEVQIEGHPVGLFASRLGWSEAADPRPEPFFVFRRALDGDLVLEAYAWPVGERMRVFHVDPSRVRFESKSIAGLETLRQDRASRPLVLVAARR